MTRDEFHNGLRLLNSIDSHEIGNPPWYGNFVDHPSRFFIRSDDETADLIWSAMERRMPNEPDIRRAALERIKSRIYIRLNDYLCEMKPNYDDSITGFNEAWDIVRDIFKDELKVGTEGGEA
jgi:hypothetical protein